MTATADAPRLLTPTGVPVGDAAPNTPEWHANRRTGIGASDVPAILGLSPYASAAHVWAAKTGQIEPDDGGEPARWGHLLEDIIAQEWARSRDVVVWPAPTLRHVTHPHHLASLDRLVDDGTTGPWTALEVKNRNAYVAGSWREDVPDDVLAQVQWQLHVTGLPRIHVACLVGGNRLVEHVVEPEATVIDYIVTAADALWEHVRAGTRPPVDSAALLLDLLDRLNPERVGAVDLDPDTVARIRGDYQAAKAAAADATQTAEAAKAELVVLLEGADTATVHDIAVCTYKTQNRTSVDAARLKERWPDAYADCAVTKPTRPVLRWKKQPPTEET